MEESVRRYHPAGKIEPDDPDFTVRWANLAELDGLVRMAKSRGLSARWSSPEAMVEQIRPGSTAILCPVLRNAEPIEDPLSFRCHIWFVPRTGSHAAVSLFDVERESFLALRELSTPEQLRKAVRVMFDWQPLVALR